MTKETKKTDELVTEVKPVEKVKTKRTRKPKSEVITDEAKKVTPKEITEEVIETPTYKIPEKDELMTSLREAVETANKEKAERHKIAFEQLRFEAVETIRSAALKGEHKSWFMVPLSTPKEVIEMLHEYLIDTFPKVSYLFYSFIIEFIEPDKPIFDGESVKKYKPSEVVDSDSILYATPFKLDKEVSDYWAAYDYLTEDNMLDYFTEGELKDKIRDIEWSLETPDSGCVFVATKYHLPEEDLDKISKFISGQNSDGLGEGFEQREFGASFDWETNDYKLKEIVIENNQIIMKG